MKQAIKWDAANNDLIIEMRVPLKAYRSNPYDDEYSQPMDAILGHIEGNEMGFAYWIDMAYKGKPDQISTLFWIYNGEKEDFKKLCAGLNIECVEEPVCVKCWNVIYGAFSWSKEGAVCGKCEPLQ